MCAKMSTYLLDEVREVLSDDSERSAAHGKVIALFLLSDLLVVDALLQVYLHSLEDREPVSRLEYQRPAKLILRDLWGRFNLTNVFFL